MNISIKKKIIGSFLLILIICFVSISFAYVEMQHFINTINNVIDYSKRVETTGDLLLNLKILIEPANDYLISGDIKERNKFEKTLVLISTNLEELKKYGVIANQEKIQQNVIDDSIKLGDMTVDILYIENPIGNKDAVQSLKKLSVFANQVIIEARKFYEITKDAMQKEKEISIEKLRKTSLKLGAGFIIMFLFIIFIFYYISNYVTKPILVLRNGVNAVKDGNLQFRVSIKTGDEIEFLADGFNNMAGSLENTKKELDKSILELFCLYSISKILNTISETQQLLDRIVENISANLKVQRVIIMLLDEKTNEFSVVSSTVFEKEKFKNLKFKIGEGLFGRIAQTGIAKLFKDLEKEPDFTTNDKLSSNTKSMIIIPLKSRQEIFGLLCSYTDKPEIFEDRVFDLFKTVGENISITLENIKLYTKIKNESITDGLTSVYNHRFFIDRFENEIERAIRYKYELSLIILDIDDFKKYNDTYGHLKGDNILINIANIMLNTMRKSDIVCRYGGEEFTIILPNTNKKFAIIVAERLREKIENFNFSLTENQSSGKITVSIGVSTLSDDNKTIEQLIKKADNALYEAKGKGKNRVISA